jgi:DNA polymerase lambda
MGYSDIQDVRQGIAENRITLSRNALLGVQYYEDLLEKMGSDEVCAIRDIVAQACLSKYEGCECEAMGSFRRGESSFGDVDVFIVNPAYHDSTPDNALHWLRDKLMNEQHISHHLTDIMTGPIRESDWSNDPSSAAAKHNQQQRHNGVQSYMGIFNSPIHTGKKRRVDIKFYPYKCRSFASIYFTGNTLFNRSMRMYATKVKRLHLSDRGLKPIVRPGQETLTCGNNGDYTVKTSLEATTEEEVFDHLGLVYQPPTERDGFDAVIPKQQHNESSASTNSSANATHGRGFTPSLNHLNEQKNGGPSTSGAF